MLVVRYRCTSGANVLNQKDAWAACWILLPIGLSVLAIGFFYLHEWIPGLVILGLALLTAFIAIAKNVHKHLEGEKRRRNAEFARKYCTRYRINSLDSAAMRRATRLALIGRDYEMTPDERLDGGGTPDDDELQNEENEKVEKCMNLMTVAELEKKLALSAEVDNTINQLIMGVVEQTSREQQL